MLRLDYHCSKKTINKDNADVEKMLVLHELACGEKEEMGAEYFTGHKKVKKPDHY